MQNEKIGARKRLVFILVGLAGQFAWCIENMYLNSYIAYLNFEATEKFDYSLMIAITTALSAIVATITTLFMGTLTDKLKKRKMFIAIGYIIWGVSTASFGLLNVNNANAIIPVSMAASTAAIMVIVVDCIMTFFGSTSNDAAFNSYVTRYTPDSKRAKVEGVLSVLPLAAMLVIFVGLNGLTTKEGGYKWDLFFYIIGAIVLIVGIVSLFLIPKEPKEAIDKDTKFFRLMSEGFKPKTIKTNKTLYIALIALFIFGVSSNVYFPYLMIYVEKTCHIANSGASFLTPFAIVMAIALIFGSVLSVVVGSLGDKYGKEKILIPGIGVLAIGLLMMFFIPFVKNDTGRTIYGAISALIMIMGYIAIPSLLNAIVRQNIPKGQEGSFMGVKMIFVVLLPMCVGPFIGDAMNKLSKEVYVDGFGTASQLPSNYNYLLSIGILLLCLIPIIFMIKNKKKEVSENVK